MSLQQFLSILIARKRYLFTIFAIVVVTTTMVSLILPRQYTAAATVLVDVKSPDPVMGGFIQALTMPGYMATQNDIITSDRVALRVVKMMGFESDPASVQAWRDATGGRGTAAGYYAALLSKKLVVKPSRESNVISIEFTSGDPKAAADIANAFAEAYIATNVELMVEPAKQYANWFVERSKQVKERLENAQAALSAYQLAKGIVSVDERLDVENTRLNELSTQLTILEAQKNDAKSRQAGAMTSIESNPDIVNNAAVQNLRAAVTAAEAKLHQAANRLGQNHPQIREQEAELNSLKARLRTEMSNVAKGLGVNTQVSMQKVSEVRDALEAQKNRVLELKKLRDEVSVLVQDVESTQREYDSINQRLAQTTLESQKQQTNIVELTPAMEPVESSSPKILLNIILSVLLGGMLGVGVALLMELMDRRIRSEEDLEAAMGIPVLGVLRIDTTNSTPWKLWPRRKIPS
jgi:chain length determinant protein EpsF